MPISVGLPLPGQLFGPGYKVQANVDFTGPLGSNAGFIFTVTTNTEQSQFFESRWLFQTQQRQIFQVMGDMSVGREFTSQPLGTVHSSDPVELLVQWTDGFTVLEDVAIPILWDPTSQLQMLFQTTAGASSGFTATDRANLTATERRTQTLGEPEGLAIQTASGLVTTTLGQLFSRQLLDTLTLDELTRGPTFDPVRVQFAGWYYGVIVRVTTIPETMIAKTPDLNWYFPDLAVLRIFRGVDLEYRRGIHTPTFMQEQPWQWGANVLNTLDVLGVPPDLTIAVDWREGCAGQVFLQRLP